MSSSRASSRASTGGRAPTHARTSTNTSNVALAAQPARTPAPIAAPEDDSRLLETHSTPGGPSPRHADTPPLRASSALARASSAHRLTGSARAPTGTGAQPGAVSCAKPRSSGIGTPAVPKGATPPVARLSLPASRSLRSSARATTPVAGTPPEPPDLTTARSEGPTSARDGGDTARSVVEHDIDPAGSYRAVGGAARPTSGTETDDWGLSADTNAFAGVDENADLVRGPGATADKAGKAGSSDRQAVANGQIAYAPLDSDAPVIVAARIRPINDRELEIGGTRCVRVDPRAGLVHVHHEAPVSAPFEDGCSNVLPVSEGAAGKPSGAAGYYGVGAGVSEFRYDVAFPENAAQEHVYAHCAAPIVDAVLTGINGSIIAYGQTGSGKTHTIEGSLTVAELHDLAVLQASHSTNDADGPTAIADDGRAGIIPRLVADIFHRIQASDPDEEFTLTCSMVEIYKEMLRDLLSDVEQEADDASVGTSAGDGTSARGTVAADTSSNVPGTGAAADGAESTANSCAGHRRMPSAVPSSGSHRSRPSVGGVGSGTSRQSGVGAGVTSAEALQLREDPERGVFVAGATTVAVTSPAHIYMCLAAGAKNRITAATGMNLRSSRSHSVFQLNLVRRSPIRAELPAAASATQSDALSYDVPAVVDGAADPSAVVGWKSTRSTLFIVDLAGSEKVDKTGATGDRLAEAQKILFSLHALGNVINALTDGRSTHVPYRDSKLTRLLQDSLGGSARTCLVITASPSPFNREETLSTLRFGARAKRMRNKPRVNSELLGPTAEIATLRQLLSAKDVELAAMRAELSSLRENGVIPLSRQLASDANGADDADVPSDRALAAEVVSAREEELRAELEAALQRCEAADEAAHAAQLAIAVAERHRAADVAALQTELDYLREFARKYPAMLLARVTAIQCLNAAHGVQMAPTESTPADTRACADAPHSSTGAVAACAAQSASSSGMHDIAEPEGDQVTGAASIQKSVEDREAECEQLLQAPVLAHVKQAAVATMALLDQLGMHLSSAARTHAAFESLQAECTGFRESLKAAEAAQTATLGEVAAAQARVQALAADAEHAASTIARLQSERDTLRAELNAAAAKIDEIQHEHGKASAEMQTLLRSQETQLTVAQQALGALQHEFDAYKATMAAVAADRDAVARNLDTARSDAEAVRKDLVALQSELHDATRRANDAQSTLRDRNELLERVQAENAGLKARAESLTSDADTLRRDNAVLATRIEAMHEERAAIITSVSAGHEHDVAAAITATRQAAKDEMESMKMTAESAERELQATIALLRTELQESRRALDFTNGECARLRDEAAALASRCDALAAGKAKDAEHLRAVQAELATVRIEASQAQHASQEARNACQQLRAELEIQAKLASDLRQDKTGLQQDLVAMKSSFEMKLADAHAQLEAETLQHGQRVKELEERDAASRAEAHRLKAELEARLQTVLAEVQRVQTACDANAATAQAEAAAAIAELQRVNTAVEEATSRADTVSAQLESERSRAEQARRRVAALEQACEDLQRDVRVFRSRLREAQDARDAAEEQARGLEQSLAAAHSDLADAQSRALTAEETVAQLQQAQLEMAPTADHHSEQLHLLRTQLAGKDAEINALLASVDALQAQITQMRSVESDDDAAASVAQMRSLASLVSLTAHREGAAKGAAAADMLAGIEHTHIPDDAGDGAAVDVDALSQQLVDTFRCLVHACTEYEPAGAAPNDSADSLESGSGTNASKFALRLPSSMAASVPIDVLWEVNASLAQQLEATSNRLADVESKNSSLLRDLTDRCHRVVELEMAVSELREDVEAAESRLRHATPRRGTVANQDLQVKVDDLTREVQSTWQAFLHQKARAESAALELASWKRKYERLQQELHDAENEPSEDVAALPRPQRTAATTSSLMRASTWTVSKDGRQSGAFSSTSTSEQRGLGRILSFRAGSATKAVLPTIRGGASAIAAAVSIPGRRRPSAAEEAPVSLDGVV